MNGRRYRLLGVLPLLALAGVLFLMSRASGATPQEEADDVAALEERRSEAPEDIDNLRALATAYLARGDCAEGLGIATRLVGLTDDAPVDRLLLARASLAEADRVIAERGGGGYVVALLADAEQSARIAAADAELAEDATVFLAFVLLRRQGSEAALAVLDQVLAGNPDQVEALALRGYLRLTGEQPVSALPDLERAIELAPGRADIRVHRAKALVHRSASAAADAFVTIVTSGLADEALAWEVYSTLAFEPDQAVRALTALAEACPEDSWVWYSLGRADADAGRFAAAVAAYDRSLELNPGEPTVLAYRGESRAGAGDPDGLVEDLLVVLASEAADLDWAMYRLQTMAAWFAERGDWEKVRVIAAALIEVNPDDAVNHGNLALALMRLDRVPESEATFRAASERFPDDSRLINDHGLLLEGVGRYEEALERFAAAAALGSLDGAENAGMLLLRLSRVTEARQRFEEVLAQDEERLRALSGFVRTLPACSADLR